MSAQAEAGEAGWRPLHDFEHLMARRVENVILACSPYDTFILQEDGQLGALLLSQFLELDLHHTTGITHVTSGTEAVDLAVSDPRYNLIVTAVQLGDMDAARVAERVREEGLDLPVVLLAFDASQLADFLSRRDTSGLERIFLWQGDPRLLLAIIKYVEDRLNVAYDSGVADVQVILLVEDDIRYYSSFLPLIYAEIVRHTQTLIGEGVNRAHRILRMRARPKILLCGSYEEAWSFFSSYQDKVLGVICDLEFPRAGRLDPDAGVELTRRVREVWPDIPVLLESGHRERRADAEGVGARFLLKGSPTLLPDLRRFIVQDFGFGDFVFRFENGTTVASAADLRELTALLHTVPAASVGFHAARNDFSRWLKARTEFDLAGRLRRVKPADLGTPENERRYLIEQIDAYRREQARGPVVDFDPTTFDPESSFARIGEGSVGGKARALAFARHLLRHSGLTEEFPGVVVSVPPAVVLATSVFDAFLDDNGLPGETSGDDDQIERAFLGGSFRGEVTDALGALLRLCDYPLAVRSSSLLEDSQYRPMAGVYRTFLLPNNDPDPGVRLDRLLQAIKGVFASAFFDRARQYARLAGDGPQQEKMAVIVQKVVGAAHQDRFYPELAGVARSYNFYPTGRLTPQDGVATLAVGLGRTVVEGSPAFSFSPRHPNLPLASSAPADLLADSQREFLAIDLAAAPGASAERHYPLSVAEADGTIALAASTYSSDNDAVYEGLARPGVRLVTFAPLRRQRDFPVPAILDRLLDLGRWGMNAEVEIEFAVDAAPSSARPAQFGFLQMRPLAATRQAPDVQVEAAASEAVLCFSTQALGHGVLTDLRDVVAVDETRFDRAQTTLMAAEIERLNARLVSEGRRYILVGFGRWGSADPWLGIPVSWAQIAGASVIVECALSDVPLTPSQGSHFFQNLTAHQVGYLTVDEKSREGRFDWAWLHGQPAAETYEYVRRFRFPEPLVVRIDGRRQRGVILKPGAD